MLIPAHQCHENALNLFQPRHAKTSPFQARTETSPDKDGSLSPNSCVAKHARTEDLAGRGGLRNLVLPGRHLPHLQTNSLLRLLTAQPPSLHRQADQVLEFSLERQELTIQIRTVYAVRVVRALASMFLTCRHGHSTALTAISQRQDCP